MQVDAEVNFVTYMYVRTLRFNETLGAAGVCTRL